MITNVLNVSVYQTHRTECNVLPALTDRNQFVDRVQYIPSEHLVLERNTLPAIGSTSYIYIYIYTYIYIYIHIYIYTYIYIYAMRYKECVYESKR